jgi:hypothetical protein
VLGAVSVHPGLHAAAIESRTGMVDLGGHTPTVPAQLERNAEAHEEPAHSSTGRGDDDGPFRKDVARDLPLRADEPYP